MSDPNDKYAGLSDDERAFAEGLGEQEESEKVEAGQVEEKPVEQGVDTQAQGTEPSNQDDFLSSLPEEQRNRWSELESANRKLSEELEAKRAEEARLRNEYAAVSGRLKPIQQKLAEYEREKAAPAKPDTQDTDEEIAALFKTEQYAEYENLFPSEAKLQKELILGAVGRTEERLKRTIAQFEERMNSRVEPVIDRVTKREEESEWESKVKALSDVHPDYKQVDASPEFKKWLAEEYPATLPSVMRRQFEDAQFRQSMFADPESVAQIITLFKDGRQNVQQTKTAEPQKPSGKDARLALSVAPTVNSGGTRRVNIAALSPEEQFLAGLNS